MQDGLLPRPIHSESALGSSTAAALYLPYPRWRLASILLVYNMNSTHLAAFCIGWWPQPSSGAASSQPPPGFSVVDCAISQHAAGRTSPAASYVREHNLPARFRLSMVERTNMLQVIPRLPLTRSRWSGWRPEGGFTAVNIYNTRNNQRSGNHVLSVFIFLQKLHITSGLPLPFTGTSDSLAISSPASTSRFWFRESYLAL